NFLCINIPIWLWKRRAGFWVVSVLLWDWEPGCPGRPPSGWVQQTLALRQAQACQGRWPAEATHPEGVVLVPSSHSLLPLPACLVSGFAKPERGQLSLIRNSEPWASLGES
ncbi:unnamed protein product, partial [Gulo gulo]